MQPGVAPPKWREEYEQLELPLAAVGYREPVGGGRLSLAQRAPRSTPEQTYWALVDSGEFIAALADPRKTRKLPQGIRREAMLLARHYPVLRHLEEIVQRGMGYRPESAPTGTIPEPPRYNPL